MKNKYLEKIALEINNAQINICTKYFNEYKKEIDDEEKFEAAIYCKQCIHQQNIIKEEILKDLQEEKEID